MKAVLISIQPTWCNLIMQDKKTVEIRKTSPRLSMPFRCFVYCTKDKNNSSPTSFGGKVCAEFVCDKIIRFAADSDCADIEKQACLTHKDVVDYFRWNEKSGLKFGFGWHISALKAFDKPKELGEFGIERAPQSWCYVGKSED